MGPTTTNMESIGSIRSPPHFAISLSLSLRCRPPPAKGGPREAPTRRPSLARTNITGNPDEAHSASKDQPLARPCEAPSSLPPASPLFSGQEVTDPARRRSNPSRDDGSGREAQPCARPSVPSPLRPGDGRSTGRRRIRPGGRCEAQHGARPRRPVSSPAGQWVDPVGWRADAAGRRHIDLRQLAGQPKP